MKRKLIHLFGLVTLFALPCPSSIAADTNGDTTKPITLAVYPFADLAEGNQGDGQRHGPDVTALIIAQLSTDFAMVERSALSRVLGEQALGESGLVTADTAARVGQLTGAKALVTGQIIPTRNGQVLMIAKVISTESGRLLAAKVEGGNVRIPDLTADLGRRVAELLRENSAVFASKTASREERMEQVLRSAMGPNRPAVSIDLQFPPTKKQKYRPSATAQSELGRILQKAGFTVVDAKSERRPDLMIIGTVSNGDGPRRGELYCLHAVMRVQVQERRTGRILGFAGTTAMAVDIASMAAARDSLSLATLQIAEQLLPVLSQ